MAALLRRFGFRQFGTFSGADRFERNIIKSIVGAAAAGRSGPGGAVLLADGSAQGEFDMMHACPRCMAGTLRAPSWSGSAR